MRTDEEIVARIEKLRPDDFFGFQSGDLIVRLPFQAALPYLQDGAVEADWEQSSADPADVLKELKDYMAFAWDKANNCRGLSAGRSINHMQAWLWLMGEDAACDALDDYSHYGKPQLRAICQKYGIDWQSLDEDGWTNSEDHYGVSSESVSTPAGLLKALGLPS